MACIASEPPRSAEDCRAVLLAVDAINPVIALMLEFSALTGLRYCDVSRLRFSDVYINGVIRDSIMVIQVKTSNKRITCGIKAREARENVSLTDKSKAAIVKDAKDKSKVKVYLNDQCKAVIEDALQLAKDKNGLMFESDKRAGKPYTAQWVNQILKRVAKGLKINYALSSHSFRKVFALLLITNGNARIHQLRDALGQSSLASTDKYLSTFMSESEALSQKVTF